MKKFLGQLSLVVGIIIAIISFVFLIIQLGSAGGKGDPMMIIVYVLVLVPVLAGAVIAMGLISFGLKINRSKPGDKAEDPDELPDLKTLLPRFYRF